MVRESGEVWLALQVQHHFGDPARDLGAVLTAALAQDEPGVVGLTDDPGEGPRLQDLVVGGPLDVTVHDGLRLLGRRRPGRARPDGAPSSRPTPRCTPPSG